jgi:hypothetical protein
VPVRENEVRQVTPHEPFMVCEPHVGERFADRLALCREVMVGQALHHLSHHTNGLFDFALDQLDDVVPEAERDSLRYRLRLAGRGLADLHRALGGELRGALQGTLIRSLYQTDRGTFICNLIVPGEVVIGMRLATEVPADEAAREDGADRPLRLPRRPGVEEADRTLNALATRIRARLSLGNQNPGGFEGFEDPEGVTPTGEPSGIGSPDPWVPALRTAVRVTDLHYAARVRCGPADLQDVSELGSDELARFHTQIDPGSRLDFYRQLGDRLPEISQAVNGVVSRVLGGPLRRLVLDAEQGALYLYPLSYGEYLLGATVDQAQVAAADERMAYVAREAATGVLPPGTAPVTGERWMTP